MPIKDFSNWPDDRVPLTVLEARLRQLPATSDRAKDIARLIEERTAAMDAYRARRQAT